MHAMDSGAPATGAGRAARLQDAMPRDAAAADAVGCPLDRAPTRRLEGANRNRGARAGATKEFRHSSGECMHAAQAHARLNSRRRGSRCAQPGGWAPNSVASLQHNSGERAGARRGTAERSIHPCSMHAANQDGSVAGRGRGMCGFALATSAQRSRTWLRTTDNIAASRVLRVQRVLGAIPRFLGTPRVGSR